jgi:hypothetical protein
MPGIPKAKVKSRIVLTPQHAKRLLKAIERIFTVLNKPMAKDTEQPPIPLNFGPAGQAYFYRKGSRNGAFFFYYFFFIQISSGLGLFMCLT